ncbi:hypothetical protein J0S82_003713 [Galemys pyrenaicus]|uniref:Uncharacterized protein n=1 Tax=Galemys pyrenaicus TaxID=202257 RepID=A0A8J6A4M8_GALPY|nr:hypothetical protein J0S82_003713 [Galemys pyrenaicus]
MMGPLPPCVVDCGTQYTKFSYAEFANPDFMESIPNVEGLWNCPTNVWCQETPGCSRILAFMTDFKRMVDARLKPTEAPPPPVYLTLLAALLLLPLLTLVSTVGPVGPGVLMMLPI